MMLAVAVVTLAIVGAGGFRDDERRVHYAAAVLVADGDSPVLCRDRHAMAVVVAAVGEGFRALHHGAVLAAPTAGLDRRRHDHPPLGL